MSRGAFFDTNILIYAFGKDDPRQQTALRLLHAGGAVSVQCLNEFAFACRRKFQMAWSEVQESIQTIVDLCDPIIPVTLDLHQLGVQIAEQYRLGLYDALLIAAALRAKCDTFWSEDLHNGLVIDGVLTVCNPFA